jgi:hypothetical protein
MKRLEEIPKKDIFEVPDGYFDKLPGVIQSRIADPRPASITVASYRLALKYAVPVVVITLAAFFIFRGNDPVSNNPEEMLAAVSTEELATYLAESDISTEDLLDNINLDEVDINELSSNPTLFDAEMEEGQLDDLLEEFEGEYY